MLLRLWETERPAAVVVGWDSLGSPTYRNEEFPSYQSGREFDADLLEQLDLLPELPRALGFASAKAPGYEADDFLAAAAASTDGPVLVATSDRDAYQLAGDRVTILQPTKAGSRRRGSGRRRCASATASTRPRCPTSSPCAATRRTSCPARAGSARNGAADVLAQYGSLEAALAAGRFSAEADALRLYRRHRDPRRHRAAAAARRPGAHVRRREPRFARELGLDRLAERIETLSTS